MKLYQKAIILSLFLHFSIASFLFLSPSHHKAQNYVLKKALPTKKQIIQTSAIDSSQIEHEIERIQANKKNELIKQQQLQKILENQASQARLNRKFEERKIASLQKHQRSLLRRERLKVLALKKKQRIEKSLLLKGQKRLKNLQDKLAKERAKQELDKKARKVEFEKIKAKKIKVAKLRKIKEAKNKALLLEQQKQANAREQQLINSEVNKYKALIINAISQNWILPAGIDSSLSCRFEIKLASTGQVINVKLLKTSGDPVLDRSAQTAIYNASPLPVPATPQAFEVFKVVSLTVKPENVIDN